MGPPKEKKAKKEKKEKKGKKGKDPNAPKRPMGAYFLFMNDYRDATKAENPDLKIGEIAKLLGQKWATIEKEEEEKEKEEEDEEEENERAKKRKANASLPKKAKK